MSLVHRENFCKKFKKKKGGGRGTKPPKRIKKSSENRATNFVKKKKNKKLGFVHNYKLLEWGLRCFKFDKTEKIWYKGGGAHHLGISIDYVINQWGVEAPHNYRFYGIGWGARYILYNNIFNFLVFLRVLLL